MSKTRSMIRIISFSIAFALATAACVEGQTVIPPSMIGARNAAMGSADMAQPHDISSIYENPAAIALLRNPSVFLNHVQGIDNEMQEDIAFPVLYTTSQMLAFGAQYYSLGELTSSSQQPRFAVAYDVAFASKINSITSLGGSVTLQRGYVAHMSNAYSASYAIGFDYAPNRDVSYGLSLTGLGTGVQFETANSLVTPVQTILQRALTVSAVLRYPTEESLQPAFLTMALGSQKVFGVSGVNFMGGVQFLPFSFLALRFGYSAGPSGYQERYGLGFIDNAFSLDVAAYPVKNGGASSLFEQLSVLMEF